MFSENISRFVNRDCAITYSLPLQKTFVKLRDEKALLVGYFDSNSIENCHYNLWNFYFRNEKNQYEKRSVDGNKIEVIRLEEEGALLYEITNNYLINQLYLSKRWETLRAYHYFYR